jgi:hypothetical protein
VNRWTRRLSLLTFGILGIALTIPVAALASCSPLEAVCLVGEGPRSGQDTVDDTIGQVFPDPVGDEVDPVVDAADPVVHDTVDTIDGLLDDVPVDPPVGGGGGTRGGGRGDQTALGREGPGNGAGPAAPRGPNATGRTLGGSRFRTPAAPIDTVVGDARPKEPSLGERLGQAIGGAARSLAVVLGLLSLVGGFVLIQNHLDRKDPRLALAPIESDVVSFA